MTMWTRCKKYINKHKIGTIINRKELLYYLYIGSPLPTGNYGTGGDNYRRCLELLGILEIVERGQYKILYHIKEDVTAIQLKKLSYNHSYRQWFNDIKVEGNI